ncbi:MAG: peptidoglycan-binding protein [Cyclobacteriaceae bacterium]|nr:peptidoglycan-binding protein [Cytophagales bacterium]MBX2899807.1 peptidoglycan-binding protein [Cyclobacteriaceae bacterium]
MSRQRVLEVAAAENGTRETPPHTNKTKYGEWYGLNGVPWCAIFISWVFDKAGCPLGPVDSTRGFQYCPSAYNYWKSHNCLTESPQPADIVLYDWNGDGICDHTGIFVKWIEPGKSFQSWEGNTAMSNDSNGGRVMLRTRQTGSVKAFVNPGVFNNDTFQPQLPLLIFKRGSKGADVVRVQKMLFDLGYSITVDGDYGIRTERVVKDFQNDQGLPTDGIVTPVLLGVMESELSRPKTVDKRIITGVFLRKGDCGTAVVTLQRALNKQGAHPMLSEDGVFGTDTYDALKVFQKKNKLMIDGVAGPQTWGVLGVRVV